VARGRGGRDRVGMMKVGSLFSGIGGFDLGLERAGCTIAWQVEIDQFATRVLTKHWPHVPKYGDIRAIDWGTVEPIDLLCGGFPCQDLSCAGKRAGLREGTRSGLWFEYLRAIRHLRPKYILVENVPGLLDNNALGRVLGDLAESGYDAEWQVLSACMFGTTHTRERVFLVAYPTGSVAQRGLPWRTVERFTASRDESEDEARDSCSEKDEVSTALLGVFDALPDRVDRLRSLGNAIVPQIAEALGRMILAVHP
jgi:DNA (cytosine-5)-methyltransferase 1